MNTRTYPRTSRDAFKGLDYSCAVERPATDYSPAWWRWMTAIAIVSGVLIWITR
jgi:hypothetical protein